MKTKARAGSIESDGRSGFVVFVKEPPSEGKANKAVIDLLAGRLNIPVSNIRIVIGKKSKQKVVEIEL